MESHETTEGVLFVIPACVHASELFLISVGLHCLSRLPLNCYMCLMAPGQLDVDFSRTVLTLLSAPHRPGAFKFASNDESPTRGEAGGGLRTPALALHRATRGLEVSTAREDSIAFKHWGAAVGHRCCARRRSPASSRPTAIQTPQTAALAKMRVDDLAGTHELAFSQCPGISKVGAQTEKSGAIRTPHEATSTL